VGKDYLDFLVEDRDGNKVVVEIKSDRRFSRKHIVQVIEYLKVTDCRLAILINFGSSAVVFKRIVN